MNLANEKKSLQEEIGELRKEAQTIVTKAETEKRAMLKDEEARFDKIIAEVEEKEKQLESVSKRLDFQKTQAGLAGNPVNGGVSEKDKRDFSKFNLLNAIDQAVRGKFEGVENEVIQEGRSEAKSIRGISASGITIPSAMVQYGREKRDLTVTGEGTDLVQTTVGGLIPLLRPMPIVQSLGAQMLTGLQGDLQLPRHNAAASMAWEGENDANAETTPTFDKVDFTPNRVGGYIDLSQKLIRQSSVSMNAWVQNELSTALGLEIDATAIYGAGSGNQPTGILNIAGIGSVAIGTDGGAPTYAAVVNTMREVDVDNALMGTVAWLTNPKVKAKLMLTPKQSSGVEGNFILQNPADLLGYRIGYSTQVPSNLDKGASTGVCSALIFGNFADLYIAQWGGVDLIVDPYTLATTGLIRVVINAYMDVQVRHPQSFAAIQDITTT